MERRPVLRVMYVGVLGRNSSSSHRRHAIERLGHHVVEFDTEPTLIKGGPVLSAIRYRTCFGPAVRNINHALLTEARNQRPDLIWFDKAVFFWPSTIRTLREWGIFTLHYNIDNPFGPRNDPGWRLVRRTIPEFDLHLVQRDSNFRDYGEAGAKDIFMLRTAYEPTLHFPPPESWSDADRLHDVVYIGAAHEQRPHFILELWRRFGISTKIWGCPRWEQALPADARAALRQGTELWNDDYRETLWRSRICIGFVTHGNDDDVAHKSFEITACGAFLLAEDTPGHRAHFRANEEAVFFTSVEDCAEKIGRYLHDEKARALIAAAGRRRAVQDGYGNDARIGLVFAYLGQKYALVDKIQRMHPLDFTTTF